MCYCKDFLIWPKMAHLLILIIRKNSVDMPNYLGFISDYSVWYIFSKKRNSSPASLFSSLCLSEWLEGFGSTSSAPFRVLPSNTVYMYHALRQPLWRLISFSPHTSPGDGVIFTTILQIRKKLFWEEFAWCQMVLKGQKFTSNPDLSVFRVSDFLWPVTGHSFVASLNLIKIKVEKKPKEKRWNTVQYKHSLDF